MTIIKTHDGKWGNTEIDPLSSQDQRIISDAVPTTSYLGMDTEFLALRPSGIIWPWDINLPQERDTNNSLTSDRGGEFDFHGDGYATELCVKANYCLDLMLSSIGRSFNWLLATKQASSILTPAVYDIPEVVEAAAPDVAKRLGCMPSTNVYGDAGEPGSLASNKRTTGCHLHISHPVLKNQDTCIALVKWADILVGCTWTYISPNPSHFEAERRKAYGRAGEYRLKIYPSWPASSVSDKWSNGVEYRTLPGTVLQHPTYLTLMFSLYRSALMLAEKYGDPQEELSLRAKNAINLADRAEAKAVIRSLPISAGGRKLIRFLRRSPVKVESVMDWYALGVNNHGHRVTYAQEHIENRSLSL